MESLTNNFLIKEKRRKVRTPWRRKIRLRWTHPRRKRGKQSKIKGRIQKGQEKREKKNPRNPGAKTSSERTNRSPGGPKKEQEKSFQRKKRGFKILGKIKTQERNRVKRDTIISKTPH